VASLEAIMDALADQIGATLSGTADPLIENLQTTGFMNIDPTPPSVDVYPADPFQEPLTMGAGYDFRLVVRARVSTADHEAGQKLLLAMMDSNATTSIVRAIKSDKTLGSKVSSLGVDSATGFGLYRDVNGDQSYMGATWVVRIMPV